MQKIQKSLAALMTLVMLAAFGTAYAAGEWHCPYCGQLNNRNFCVSCGAPRPEEPVWAEDDIADPDLAAKSRRIVLQGDVPQPIDPPPGCPFASRCRFCKPLCREQTPEMKEISPGHYLACHLN